MWAGTMTQQIKSLLGTPTPPMRVPVKRQRSTPLLTHLPAGVPGKQLMMAQYLSLSPMQETQRWTVWFLTLAWPSQGHCDHQGMNQRMEESSSVSTILCFQINKNWKIIRNIKSVVKVKIQLSPLLPNYFTL